MEQSEIELSVLWTLPATFPFYQAVGFQPLPPQMQWLHCTREDASAFRKSPHYEIVPLQGDSEAHIASVEALYQREESGIVRSRRDTIMLFTLPTMVTHLAVSKEGEVHGYLTCCAGTHKPGILEARGSQEVIESLLNHCLSTLPLPQIPVYVDLNPGNLFLTLNERLPSRISPMESGPMMLRINHPSRFLNAIQHRIPPALAEACRKLDRAAMTAALFGVQAECASGPAPGYFPIPMLDHS